MYMLHKMSEIRGWSHNDMMSMDKCTFYRYYGYWYADVLNEEIARKHQEAMQKVEARRDEPKKWKTL